MFKSCLSNDMNNFLKLRNAIVAKTTFASDKTTLLSIDNFMLKQNYQEKYLTENFINTWISTLTGTSRTINGKINTVRNFSKYLNSLGGNSFMPNVIKVKSDYIPYIYSDKELKDIIYTIDNLVSQHSTYSNAVTLLGLPVIIRILYGCGTRLGETLELRRKDIDFENETIFLYKTKFSKERLIPMHSTLAKIIKDYCINLGIFHNNEAYLFPGRRKNTHISERSIYEWFTQVLKLLNIDQQRNTTSRGACLHSFRNLFILKSMQQLEKLGHSVNVNDLLLPTYLGHECLIDTDQYMKFSGVQIPETLECFEHFTFDLIPKVEVPYEEE